tara:strand:+ start:419 stop:769 length:351 start_codon:yes stop_codon:yes gene_type:complete
MALGNSFSMGQARGKNKPILVQRRKEVILAKDYTLVYGTAVQGTSACALSLGDVEYYHDGSSNLPTTSDKIYSRKRLNNKFNLANGHYKIHHASDTRTAINIELRDGAITRVTACP